ncbi:hypothetical protein BS47DRAFT_1393647 [Hydnum rufescens UP504]|uniref:G domain-containing protein n=1 Tax=Hydnum rufescens UP504 TaxID=1448309 RepID=A0A9P6AWB7_9AGAM|nr:hypothetical protein BS47DRAFT_1393647 [Hydnum rufescens UP504]
MSEGFPQMVEEHEPVDLAMDSELGDPQSFRARNFSMTSVRSNLLTHSWDRPGIYEIPDLCSYIMSTPPTPITHLKWCKNRDGVKHEFLLLKVERPDSGGTVWLRLERRLHENARAVKLCGDVSRLFDASRSQIQVEAEFTVRPLLQRLGVLLSILMEYSSYYKLYSENCYFFCAVVYENSRVNGAEGTNKKAYGHVAVSLFIALVFALGVDSTIDGPVTSSPLLMERLPNSVSVAQQPGQTVPKHPPSSLDISDVHIVQASSEQNGVSIWRTDPTHAFQGPLTHTTETLQKDCRFRILVVGKSGVGKSSLINAVFGAKNLTRTSDYAMKHDIDQELTFDDNRHLILHDSEGFFDGDIKNLQTVQEFIKRRSAERELKDRLHAIWLCCEVPVSGGRLFELGDEILLKDDSIKGILIGSLETGVSMLTVGDVSSCIPQVPIIVVFTKYDQLVIRKKADLARSLGHGGVEWERQAKETAAEAVKVSCEKPLNAVAGNKYTWTEVSNRDEYKDTIERLINLTMNSLLGVPAKATNPKTQATTGKENADRQYGSLKVEECDLLMRCHDDQGSDTLRTSKLAKNSVKSLSIL